jgi:hypothetical protein
LWKKVRRNVGSAVDPLALSPVRDQLTPELDWTLATVRSLEGQEILPVRGFHGGTFDCPSEIPQVPFLKAQLFPLLFTLFTLERLTLPRCVPLAAGQG